MSLLSRILGRAWQSAARTSGDRSNPSFQEQLDTFLKLGFTLNQGIEISDINRWQGGLKEFEDLPYHLLYQTLGQTIERKPWTPITNDCWNFDLEAITDPGAYVDVMQNISRITKGDLVFENLEDHVNIDLGTAWVSFTCNGDTYRWELKVQDDWADADLFDKVQELAIKYNLRGRFTYFNTGGQDFVLGYHSPEELASIRESTGLDIVWLNA
jgi:hypothetical protein